MISRISDYLHPDESVIILTRRHPETLIAPIIVVVAGLTAALLYTASRGNNGIIVILIWSAFGLLVMNLIYKALEWWAACFVVSSKRMLLITGVVTRWSDSLDLDEVKDIGFERSVVNRLLGYGSFVFSSAGNNQKLHLIYISMRATVLDRRVCATKRPCSFGVGLFAPKPRQGAVCQHRRMPDLGTTVHPRPLASAAGRGDCYSLGYSVARVVLADRECPPIIMASGPSVSRGRGRLPLAHSRVE